MFSLIKVDFGFHEILVVAAPDLSEGETITKTLPREAGLTTSLGAGVFR